MSRGELAETRPDHGGGVDAAALRWGGARAEWIDLSTGINPCPYPVPPLPPEVWGALPDEGAETALTTAARSFWRVPPAAAVLAAPGASALIARMSLLAPVGRVYIPGPTYNEHGRAFAAAGWRVTDRPEGASAAVIVRPNNPDGRMPGVPNLPLVIVDESFCDTSPHQTQIALAARPGRLILKSFGKFWGLAGLRLGFAIGDPALLAGLAQAMGPWPVSGPALAIGTVALRDQTWAEATRARLTRDAARLDTLMKATGAAVVGGTPLFRLYQTGDAALWQDRLARHRIWTRIFPYSRQWIRLGLPGTEADWLRLEAALA